MRKYSTHSERGSQPTEPQIEGDPAFGPGKEGRVPDFLGAILLVRSVGKEDLKVCGPWRLRGP